MSTEPVPPTDNRGGGYSHKQQRCRDWWAEEQQKITETTTTPLSEAEAKRLDKRIRLIVTNISDKLDKLAGLIAEAKAGQAHVSLGFASWTAYLADALQIKPQNLIDRRKMVFLFSDEGMSQRAIASALDVDQKTVSNDLRSREEDSSREPEAQSPSNVVGLDGKRYPRERKPSKGFQVVREEPKHTMPSTVEVDAEQLAQDRELVGVQLDREGGRDDSHASPPKTQAEKLLYLAISVIDRTKFNRTDYGRIGDAIVRLIALIAPKLTDEQRNRIAKAVMTVDAVTDA